MARRRRYRGYRRKDGRVDLRRLPRIVEAPLGQERAYGMAAQLLHGDVGAPPPDPKNGWDGEPTIWLDPAYAAHRRGLETAVHESLHLACPWMFEEVVTPTARYVAMVLWKLGYRRPD